MSVVKLLNVSVDDAVKVVVETPVAPVIAPADVIVIDGVERKFVNPVEDAKRIPLIILLLLFVAAKNPHPDGISAEITGGVRRIGWIANCPLRN